MRNSCCLLINCFLSAAFFTLAACEMDGSSPSVDQELAKITQLHERDEAASRTADFETLRSLMSEDAVLMPPGKDWVRGVQALDQHYARMAEAMTAVEVTDYRLDFEEVVVVGDYAFEWGTIRGAVRPRGSEPSIPPDSSSYKVLRVLKKNPDGEWRVHRAIWNVNPPE